MRAERVCGCWRNLVYSIFTSIKLLDLDDLYLYQCDERFIIKYLILTGEKLEELKTGTLRFKKYDIFKVITQLCANLKTLDLSMHDFKKLKSIAPVLLNLKKFVASHLQVTGYMMNIYLLSCLVVQN